MSPGRAPNITRPLDDEAAGTLVAVRSYLAAAAEQSRSRNAQVAETRKLELLAQVTHELGNPLMIVKFNVAAIQKALEERGAWPADLNQRAEDVASAVERMLGLRDELLAASRDEERGLDLVPQPLVHVLRRVVRWGRPSAEDKSIELTEDCPNDLPYVVADESALQSIFTNLLSNAVRYTAGGGVVAVTARHEPPHVVVRFTDSGIGISEADLPRVFERFYRTAAARSGGSAGFGLGLAITRELVLSMGGSITLKSKLGAGSTFAIALPVAGDFQAGEGRRSGCRWSS